MEKKNTILLTVIAIATLLVAVVGATFAYFTATVTTDNDANNTVNAKTYALTEVQMDYGNKVNIEGMYPGTIIEKFVSIKANCPTVNGAVSTTCEPVNTIITITAEDPDNVFDQDIKWSLFKMDSKDETVTCDVEEKNTTGKYYSETTCTGFDPTAGTLDKGTLVDSGTGAGTTTIDIKAYGVEPTSAGVKDAHDDKYYLIVEYLNNDTLETDENGNNIKDSLGHDIPVQNKQQGHSFSVTMNFDTAAI